jgi:hypothetical protein
VTDQSPQASARCPEKSSFAAAKQKLIQLVLNNQLLKSVAPGVFDGDPNLIRIVKGIEAFGWLRGADKIRKAGELLGLTYTDDEVKAWKHLRNQPAHGDFDFDSQNSVALQESHWNAAKVAGMLNRLVLGLIGYRGPIRDYSTQGFPTVSFR